MRPEDRLIVALDVSSTAEAQKIVRGLGAVVSTYKVGNQLFTAEGPGVVRDLVGSGKKVFLDLKFHDIPNTVAGGVRSAAELGASGNRYLLKNFGSFPGCLGCYEGREDANVWRLLGAEA